MALPLAARAVVSLQRSGDGICDLVGYSSIGRRHQIRSRVNRCCIYNSVEEIAKLRLRILKDRCPPAPREARRS
jgi:hypothetical protein